MYPVLESDKVKAGARVPRVRLVDRLRLQPGLGGPAPLGELHLDLSQPGVVDHDLGAPDLPVAGLHARLLGLG